MERSPEMLFQPHQGGSHVTRNTVQAPRNNIRSPLRISGVFREIRPEDSSDLKTPFRPGKNHLESLTCFHTLAHPSRGTGAQPSAACVVCPLSREMLPRPLGRARDGLHGGSQWPVEAVPGFLSSLHRGRVGYSPSQDPGVINQAVPRSPSKPDGSCKPWRLQPWGEH